MSSFTQEQIEEIAYRIAQSIEQHNKEMETFVKERQDQTISDLSNYLKINRFIDRDDFAYADECSILIDAKDFDLLFESLMSTAKKLNKLSVDEDVDFPNHIFYVKYKNEQLIFFIMWGQGTCKQVFIDPESWREDFSFDYEEVKKLKSNQQKTP